jgi:hypothetical protein
MRIIRAARTLPHAQHACDTSFIIDANSNPCSTTVEEARDAVTDFGNADANELARSQLGCPATSPAVLHHKPQMHAHLMSRPQKYAELNAKCFLLLTKQL